MCTNTPVMDTMPCSFSSLEKNRPGNEANRIAAEFANEIKSLAIHQN